MNEFDSKISEIKNLLKTRSFEEVKIKFKAIDLELLSLAQLLELADILTRANLLLESKDCWQKAVQKVPTVAELRSNLGLVLLTLGDVDNAKLALEAAISLKPDFAQALFNLGKAYRKLQDLPQACDALEKAISAGFTECAAFKHYAAVLFELAQYARAIIVLRKALSLYPDDLDLKYLIAFSLQKTDLHKDAIDFFRELEKGPKADGALFNGMGVSLNRIGKLSEAEEAFRKVSGNKTIESITLGNLGSCLVSQGRIKEGLSILLDLVKSDPEQSKFHNMLCMSANYDQQLSNDDLKNIHFEFDKCFQSANPVAFKAKSKIHIAYISGNFQQHSVAYFLRALFQYRDREKFHITVFSDSRRNDEVSQWFNSVTDAWVSSVSLNDEDFYKVVKDSNIDIAFDLAGHTDGNRLSCFAQRLAPIQISYLGYPNTTGLKAIDYRITDSLCDPEGYDQFYSEKLIRLEQSFLCYTPAQGSPEINSSPVNQNNFITFGSFNALQKTNELVVETWASIMSQLADSRLILKAASLIDPVCRKRIENQFEKYGVYASRLTLLPHQAAWEDHMQDYSRLDIALDPFPYNGTTTTFEALYMGVPVVTLVGSRHSARVGYSILSNLGAGELCAETTAAYIKIAVDLAKNKMRLNDYRHNFRQRLINSILCNGKIFTNQFEDKIKLLF